MKHLLFALLIGVSLNQEILSDEVAPGVLRTPDDRFENLRDYPFEANYMEIDGLRIHYLDEGPKDADPIILFHGEPAWSYLFRKMIPVLTEAGYRVVVPDMVGFGKSDKFESKHDYSYKHHVDVMKELVEKLDLENTTHFGQDWGGLVGLRVVAEMPDRFATVCVKSVVIITNIFAEYNSFAQAAKQLIGHQTYRPRGTFSNRVGTILCCGCYLPLLVTQQ